MKLPHIERFREIDIVRIFPAIAAALLRDASYVKINRMHYLCIKIMR